MIVIGMKYKREHRHYHIPNNVEKIIKNSKHGEYETYSA